MIHNLKTYDITLTTLSPLFIGSGKEINKKTYIVSKNEQKVWVMNPEKLYYSLSKNGKQFSFEKYILNSFEKASLSEWLSLNNVRKDNLSDSVEYRIDAGDRFNYSNKSQTNILEFVKDPYGLPYVPGSSLKGMIRTVLLAENLLSDSKLKRSARNVISENISRSKSRKSYLNYEISDIESKSFRKLYRNNTKPSDAVNDILQGLIVGDSKPLSVDDLVLCQKIDVHPNGQEKSLNILRECIKPGVMIRFPLTIDTSVCKYSIDDILTAVEGFANQYYENFAIAFKNVDRPSADTIYLGGGVGFVSKTIIYPVFGLEDGVNYTSTILGKTVIKGKNSKDVKLGVSPHILKCTYYQGKLYEMGKCKISIQELQR